MFKFSASSSQKPINTVNFDRNYSQRQKVKCVVFYYLNLKINHQDCFKSAFFMLANTF